MTARIPLIAVIAELRRCNRPGRCLAMADYISFSRSAAPEQVMGLKPTS